jgi:hypothetical protein
MLVRLMYASRTKTDSPVDLQSILRQSQANNPKLGVTGVLCYSNGIFLQVIEGGRTTVNQLYNRIVSDPRHSQVEILSFDEIHERRFATWSMGQVNLSHLNTSVVMKYSETATVDPYKVSGAASMALFNELIATASILS